ncbi:MAG TPA: PQQ-binding-like beta-propeller repeat protein [Steroidobacteraceae bacterium]|nr:PQQ-binding-like beta-propeller repeat protein [Steroidobacteraceae bacterium]
MPLFRSRLVQLGLLCVLSIHAAIAADASAPVHPGKALYEKHCGSCHDKPDLTRAVPFAQLRNMRLGNLFFAMTNGKMKEQAAALNEQERGQLVDYIVGRQQIDESWVDTMRCQQPGAGAAKLQREEAANVLGFGFTRDNRRQLSHERSGIATADVPHLELAWALAFPRASTMRAQAAVVGNALYLPVTDEARVFAVDISGGKPCFQWVYASNVPLRTGVAYGVLASGRPVLAFADAAVNVHLVDARTGKLIWKTPVGRWDLSNATGTPQIFGGRVYMPISASEINFGGEDSHECCKTHGMFVALDASNGRIVWRYQTMPDAKPVRDRGDGKKLWGPSGAPIWSSPALDARRGLLYVGTGEATSAPAADTIDSVLALEMATGKLRWKFQATADDIFLTSCLRQTKGLNCPREGRLLDVDFGASPILAHRKDGRDVLLAGQKSGTLWALDPDSGKLLWNREFGKGSPLGGIHWGMAANSERVFVPIHKMPDAEGNDPNQTPGLHAVDFTTGEVRWSFTATADCSGDRKTRVPTCNANIGLSAAPAVIDGAVFEGSADGFLRAFDVNTGTLLWKFDTARPYDGINGVKGHGGAIDNASIVAANGYVFVNSGYALIGGQRAGNVFLAFRRRQ